VAGCALTLAPAAGSGVAAREQAGPHGRLSDLRVCAYEAFSRKQARCTRDMRGTVLSTNRLSCSIEVSVRRPARLHASMTYLGQVQYEFTTDVLDRGPWRWWIAVDIEIDKPIPAGAWTCGFDLRGAVRRASFTSGGPRGAVVNLAACTTGRARDHGGFVACLSDESSSSFAPGVEVVCNGDFVDRRGRLVRIDLVSDGSIVDRGRSSLARAPLWIMTEPFVPPRPGAYTCRFTAGDEVVGELPFHVTD
jgi:hypothetical protein